MSLPTGPGLLLALWFGIAIFAAGHALITRRDPRTAWGWIAVCWLFPFAGPALYFLFGINRVRTHARRLGMDARQPGAIDPAFAIDVRSTPDGGVQWIPPWLEEVARTTDTLTRLPLVAGNRVSVLHNGDQAYPRMLEAIDRAQSSIALATYIFDNDGIGKRFVDALARARGRGVAVHVMLDGFGQHYSLIPVTGTLRRQDISVAIFNPLRLLPPSLHLNLRNHRKLLLVDGSVGFTGGMNIGDRHLVEGRSDGATDIHFELRGPVLAQLGRVFADDWAWCIGSAWPQPHVTAPSAAGAACRAITDGPNEDHDHLALVLQAAISAARREVLVMTPYFLPPNELMSELQAAALRGVRVEIVLPARNNLPFVHWATRNVLGELLKFGARVYYQPPPFSHSKLFVVDGVYAQIGSANLDARSLKLNFELAVEVYDRAFAQTLSTHFNDLRARSREVSVAEIAGRSLLARLRDAVFWLFSPYL